MPAQPPSVVIDTNIVLDVFVFEDPGTAALQQALEQRRLRWFASPSMRRELERVLDYPLIARRLRQRERTPAAVLLRFDALVDPVEEAAKAIYTCKDPDDQKFIDLAVAHRSRLLSKDAAVLCMARRLERLGVAVGRHWSPPPTD